MNDRALLVLYDETQASLATPGTRVACMNFWLERELKARGVTPVSLGDYPLDDKRAGEITTAVRDAARKWYRLPAMQFFEHKGIPLGEAFEPMIDIYLTRLAYWRSSLERVLDAAPEVTELVIPYSEASVMATAGSLASFETHAVVDAARSLAAERGLAFRSIGNAPHPPIRHLYPRSRLQEAAVALYNFFIGLAPRRSLKVFASEYWRNIAPFIERMDDVELVLMERSEFRTIPWKQLWKHRIRFMHPRAISRGAYRATTEAVVERFRDAWLTARETLKDWKGWESANVSWAVVEPALDYLVWTYAERLVADIEGLEYILARERPDRVLLRASVGSSQPHFFLAARVARRLGIPSVELQHAGAAIDPSSVHSRLEADYLASYGPYEGGWCERNGYAPERVVSIGSPRFDRCITERTKAYAHGQHLLQEAGLDGTRPVLLVAVREDGTGFKIDSYTLADFFRTVARVQVRMPELQIVFKFRSGKQAQAQRAFVRELLPRAVCMAREDLFSLICASTIVMCGNSTVLYEALLGERPLVLYPWYEYYALYARYTHMYTPAAPIVKDDDELPAVIGRVLKDKKYRQELVTRGREFLKGYSFDGKSAERMAALLRRDLVSYYS